MCVGGRGEHTPLPGHKGWFGPVNTFLCPCSGCWDHLWCCSHLGRSWLRGWCQGCCGIHGCRLVTKAWVLLVPGGHSRLQPGPCLVGAGPAAGPSESNCYPNLSLPLGGLQAKTHNQVKQQEKEGFICSKSRILPRAVSPQTTNRGSCKQRCVHSPPRTVGNTAWNQGRSSLKVSRSESQAPQGIRVIRGVQIPRSQLKHALGQFSILNMIRLFPGLMVTVCPFHKMPGG